MTSVEFNFRRKIIVVTSFSSKPPVAIKSFTPPQNSSWRGVDLFRQTRNGKHEKPKFHFDAWESFASSIPVSCVIIIYTTRLISDCTNYDIGAIHRIEIVFRSICMWLINSIAGDTFFAHRLGFGCWLTAYFRLWNFNDDNFFFVRFLYVYVDVVSIILKKKIPGSLLAVGSLSDFGSGKIKMICIRIKFISGKKNLCNSTWFTTARCWCTFWFWFRF